MSEAEGKRVCGGPNGFLYMETSAKTGQNVDEMYSPCPSHRGEGRQGQQRMNSVPLLLHVPGQLECMESTHSYFRFALL